MNTTELIGLGAAFCTSLAFVPQVWRVWMTRSTRDISLRMYSVFIAGVTLWLVYGILMKDWAITLANGFTLLLASCVVVMKLIFEHQAQGKQSK